MNIAVTGANGFLGRYLVERLTSSGHRVTAVGRDLGELRDLFGKRVDAHQSDYSLESLTSIFRGQEVVVHLAAARLSRQTHPYRITQFQQSNVVTTENVILAALEANVRRFCQTSSQSVYSSANTLPFREDEAAYPANVYGVAKLACEKLASLVGDLTGLQVVNLRLARLYGEGDRPDLVPQVFVDLARQKKVLHVFDSGSRRIDYLYVKDAGAAVERAATGTVQRGTFNIGSGRSFSIRELAEAVNLAFDNVGNIEFDETPQTPAPENFPPVIEMDASLTRATLGWTPEWTLEDALKDMGRSKDGT